MLKKIIITAIILIMSSGYALAMDHSGHQMSMPKGKKIRTVMVEGFHLDYYLIDNAAEMKKNGLAMVAGMKSHHLMVYVTDTKGKMIANGKVGYLVSSADGTRQKVMTMAMNMGHGGDVELKPGENRIKVKIIAGSRKIIDEFTINR